MKKTIVFISFCIMVLICALAIHYTEPYVGPGAAIFIVVPTGAVILMNIVIKVYERYG